MHYLDAKEHAMTNAAKILEIPATITERGQTTVPAPIRKMLALGKRDRVVFRGLADGTVVIEKRSMQDEDDPALGAFLDFLGRDIAARPHAIRPIDAERIAYAKRLVEGVEVDLDAPLDDER
jgi:antitoxin PrlF